MTKKRFYLVIHGHFYQPPREDPFTGEIDLQDSAYPWHDWNERITKECYEANASSRVLDDFGHIEAVINNYEYISFNFGPTLLSYLEKYHRRTYEKIIEADFRSREKNGGHGNAIAQGYNHMILPLASNRDKITQIEWAIKDFEKRFERQPEGIWLPEAAVNDVVVQFLIDYGIRFIILSPHEIEKVRHLNGTTWIDVSQGNIDVSMPYLLRQPNGEINVFVYHGALSHAVSFNHLLRSYTGFRDAILSHANPSKDPFFLSIATDGEIYGHHEPFGDMCLSALIYRNQFENNFIFTNFANVLDIIKPTHELTLKKGHNNLGVSWSCFHGVDRWYRDCGCNTGAQHGWNQQWREPLRNALDFLRDELYRISEEVCGNYLKNIWKARNDYIDLVFIRSSKSPDQWEFEIDRFIDTHKSRDLTSEEVSTVLKFLEALYNEMLMYTSCGWFFADISGIETVQVMKYPSYIFYLLKDYISPEVKNKFLYILSRAKSNIREFNDGRWIFENWIERNKFIPEKIISQFVLSKYISDNTIPEVTENYYFYTIYLKNTRNLTCDGFEVFRGIVSLRNNITLEENDYIYYFFVSHELADIRIYTKEYFYESMDTYIDKVIKELNYTKVRKFFDDWFYEGYTLSDIKYEIREKVLYKLFERKFGTLKLQHELDISEYLKIIQVYSLMDVRLPENEKVLISYLFKEYLDTQSEKLRKEKVFDKVYTREIINLSKKHGINISLRNLSIAISSFISEYLPLILKDPLNREYVNSVSDIIDFAVSLGIEIENRRHLEDMVYEYLEDENGFKKFISEMENSKENLEKIKGFWEIAEKLNISSYKYRRLLK